MIKDVSRRDFCRLAGSGVALGPKAFALQPAARLTAREVVERIKQHVGVPWHTPTADEFKAGNPDAPISGIATSFMSTLDVLQRAHRAGLNFVISHEPTFWSADDEVSVLRDDPLYREKLAYIESNHMVVWRFHDHWHAHRPDGIFTGWNRAMSWAEYETPSPVPMTFTYTLPETTVEQLARQMQSKLKVNSLRLVGDPDMPVRRVGNAGHYITTCMELLPHVDALLVFESREWEAAAYVRDAITTGASKALLQLPHEGGEEEGMNECARWLAGFVTEVPVQFLSSGDPFWIPS